ncbi:LysR family transcriptional regulator [Gemmata sp. JC717]|uniref:LysR family transcriptional regulator n=1 Tax=Gemmata algarum TaxID=2975278 RepID=A0ABU5F1U8_9BACT|nr:LysR family transcriptional regulator [Gemmata algarum]MDY3552446.1 LysR family transcriptional regulator [Gemmata algarum]MDY3561562.1 LysR family transcriptional regulator [Gemmata algarum]
MKPTDLKLLLALDALLAEGSVAGAARRLKLSEPATSRALSQLRTALGDELLVRAGRRLVPTPRALALRGRVRALVEQAEELFRPDGDASPSALERAFSVRANDAFAGAYAPRLVARVLAEAPGVTLRFVPEGDEDIESLRSGAVDLDVGALGRPGPEMKSQRLFADEFVGVVGPRHPLAASAVTAERFAEFPHVSASRRGLRAGPIDDALRAKKLARTVAVVVPSFSAALFAVAGSDQLVGAVPAALANEGVRLLGLSTFKLPVRTKPLEVYQVWHPRFDADPGHRWLRGLIRSVAAK